MAMAIIKTKNSVTTLLQLLAGFTLLYGLYNNLRAATIFFQPSDLSTATKYVKLTSFVQRRNHITPANHNNSRIITPLRKCLSPNGNFSFPQVPAFIVPGAQKAGTTALFHILNLHPSIISKRGNYEGHFFNREIRIPHARYYNPLLVGNLRKKLTEEKWCEKGKKYIGRIFQRRLHVLRNHVTFEKTPVYLVNPHIPELVSIVCPWKPKVIIFLRDPVDRAYSHFDMDGGWDHFTMDPAKKFNYTFDEVVRLNIESLEDMGIILPSNSSSTISSRYRPSPRWLNHSLPMNISKLNKNMLYRGFYANQIRPWLKHFPMGDKLRIFRYETFMQRKAEVMKEILEFVGVDNFDYTEDDLHTNYFRKNKTDHREVNEDTRLFLKEFYRGYNDDLADLLGEEWRGVWD